MEFSISFSYLYFIFLSFFLEEAGTKGHDISTVL